MPMAVEAFLAREGFLTALRYRRDGFHGQTVLHRPREGAHRATWRRGAARQTTRHRRGRMTFAQRMRLGVAGRALVPAYHRELAAGPCGGGPNGRMRRRSSFRQYRRQFPILPILAPTTPLLAFRQRPGNTPDRTMGSPAMRVAFPMIRGARTLRSEGRCCRPLRTAICHPLSSPPRSASSRLAQRFCAARGRRGRGCEERGADAGLRHRRRDFQGAAPSARRKPKIVESWCGRGPAHRLIVEVPDGGDPPHRALVIRGQGSRPNGDSMEGWRPGAWLRSGSLRGLPTDLSRDPRASRPPTAGFWRGVRVTRPGATQPRFRLNGSPREPRLRSDGARSAFMWFAMSMRRLKHLAVSSRAATGQFFSTSPGLPGGSVHGDAGAVGVGRAGRCHGRPSNRA